MFVGDQQHMVVQSSTQIQKIMDERQPSMDNTPKINQQRASMLIVLLLLIIIAISALLILGQPISSRNTNSLGLSLNTQEQFSKIMWVQRETSSGQSRMVRQIINNNLFHFGRESGYQIRAFDNFNAYDWLSPTMSQFVQQAKQKSLFSIDISQILRVALLYEHGGISIRHSCFLNGNLEWVEDIFRLGQNSLGVEYFGIDKNPQILLFYKEKDEKRVYKDDVMVARRGSKLLQETLREMSQFLIKGEVKDIRVDYSLGEQSAQRINWNSLFVDLVNSKQNARLFGLMSIDMTMGSFLMSYESVEILKTDILQDPNSFQLKNGKKHIIQADFDALSDTFLQMLDQKYSLLIKKNTILRSKIIDIGTNYWMTNQIAQTRQVHFCIISLKVLQKDYYQSVSKSVAALQKQAYTAWKAVYFTDGKQGSPLNFEKGEVLKSSGSQGVDLQHVVTSHCDPRDVAVLLNYDQKFERQDGLQTIAKVMIQRKYFGAFLSAKNQSSNINSTLAGKEIKRQIGKANSELFREIADNFRVFRISSYRFIPLRALHDKDGNYYNREIVFLGLLEMGWGYESCEGKNEIAYNIKKIEQKVDIPKYRAHIADVLILMADSKQLNLSRPQYYLKYRSERICDSMKQFHAKTHRDLQEFFILNDGSNIQTNSNTAIIPKKIHTIIFGEELLNIKYRLIRQSKKTLLSYKHLIWQQANITRSNFPYTYDTIMAIRKSNVLVRESTQHQQVIINLMRLQILYWHGGIYLDPHYLIINWENLDKLLLFEAILPAMPLPNSYSVEMNSIIAAMQHYRPLLDLLNPKLLSSIDFYSKDAVEQTGSIMLGRLLSNKGISNTIFQSSVQYFQPDYPDIRKIKQGHQKKSCKTGSGDKKTSFLGYVYDGDCRVKYGWALGVSL